MDVKHISPAEALRRITEQGHHYIDVRSMPEFSNGHPEPAVNIPLFHLDPRTGQRIPNQDFLAVVQAHFDPDAPLILGCQSGQRSAQAVQMLQKASYTHVVNMSAGFGGVRDSFGRIIEPGWMALGFPTSFVVKPEQSYQTLVQKVQNKDRCSDTD